MQKAETEALMDKYRVYKKNKSIQVKIRNKSTKHRSLGAMKRLKFYAEMVCVFLDLESYVDTINITYLRKRPAHCKAKPLYGFHVLYNNRNVRIRFFGPFDKNQFHRQCAIIHELCHVKQLVKKELVITNDFKDAYWHGRINYSWKKFSFKKYRRLPDDEKDEYVKKIIPWEKDAFETVRTILNMNIII